MKFQFAVKLLKPDSRSRHAMRLKGFIVNVVAQIVGRRTHVADHFQAIAPSESFALREGADSLQVEKSADGLSQDAVAVRRHVVGREIARTGIGDCRGFVFVVFLSACRCESRKETNDYQSKSIHY